MVLNSAPNDLDASEPRAVVQQQLILNASFLKLLLRVLVCASAVDGGFIERDQQEFGTLTAALV